MRRAFSFAGRAGRDLFDEFVLLALCNMVWAVLCQPLIFFAIFLVSEGGSPLLAGLILIANVLTTGPASAALAAVALRICEGRSTKLTDFFAAMRHYAKPGWALMGFWTAGAVLILFNISFYAAITNLLAAVIYGLWIYALIIWFAVQIYLFPLLIQQPELRLRIVIRNAFVLALGRPLITFTSFILMVLLLVVSVFLPVLFAVVTVSFLAIWGSRITYSLLEEERQRRAEAAETADLPPAEKGRRGQVRPK